MFTGTPRHRPKMKYVVKADFPYECLSASPLDVHPEILLLPLDTPVPDVGESVSSSDLQHPAAAEIPNATQSA
ncbi:hypothetical protein N7504_000904 [Penicillium tannophilum]|nr:hypothetical protein N7504_000904 [Penicillium tannophilum]